MSYKKNNVAGKGLLAGILGGVLALAIAVGGYAIYDHYAGEDTTQEAEDNEKTEDKVTEESEEKTETSGEQTEAE